MARLTADEYFRLTGQRLPPTKELPGLPRKNKMNNVKTDDGYDSKLEQGRAQQLRMEQRLGLITDLEEQKVFILQENFKLPSKKTKSGEETIKAITYRADFVYKKIGEDLPIVEDTKGHETEVFKIKKKMFLKKYFGIYKFIQTIDKHGTIKN